MDDTVSPAEVKPLPLISDLRESNSRSAKELRLTELRWFDAAIKPYLYRLVRYRLELPGGLSSRRSYWLVPRLGFKVCLKTGQVYSLASGARIAGYFDLWMCGEGFCKEDATAPKEALFPKAKETLRRWIEEQQQRQPAPDEIPLFTEDLAKLDWIFFYIMFERGLERAYRGTARKIWLEFERIHGPIRTRRIFDLSSHHQLLSFLRYRSANPSPLFKVEKVSGPRKKEEIWEMQDRGFNSIAAEFTPYAEAYAAAHRAAGLVERGNSVSL
jgi:hypothetical protein